MINYVLQVTQEEKLVYIGNSMGSVMGFAGFSTQPELEAKVKLFIALAPVARVGHIEGPLALIADIIHNTGIVVSWRVHYNITSHLLFSSLALIQFGRIRWRIYPK